MAEPKADGRDVDEGRQDFGGLGGPGSDASSIFRLLSVMLRLQPDVGQGAWCSIWHDPAPIHRFLDLPPTVQTWRNAATFGPQVTSSLSPRARLATATRCVCPRRSEPEQRDDWGCGSIRGAGGRNELHIKCRVFVRHHFAVQTLPSHATHLMTPFFCAPREHASP